jgi:acyl-CoA synthetase (NDP forming)
MGRALYARADLLRLLEPRSIAIVGASARAGSFGNATMHQLANFQGELMLVSATTSEIDGRPAYRSLSELPSVPDCVIVAVPRDAVLGVVKEAASIGAGGAIVFASGFAETGRPEHVALQRELTKLAEQSGLKIIGPNCIGIVNYDNQALATFSTVSGQSKVLPHAIGLASQSGAMAHAMGQGIERGVNFSHLLAAGNSCDVDVADMVAYLAEDPACRSIACIFEGMAEPQRLFEAAERAWAANKPLLVYKLATGEQGAAAAASHTGSLAGAHVSWRAAFERVGAILVDDFEALLEMAAFFAKAPAPLATGVAVIATSGGAAVMCADKAEPHGVELPQPSPETRAVLEKYIPEFGSANNPCDVTAQVINDPASLSACVEALAADPAYGVIVMPLQVAFESIVPRGAMVSEIAAMHGKVACNLWLSEWLQGPGNVAFEQNGGLGLFRSADRLFKTIAAWQWRATQRARRPISDRGTPHPKRDAVGKIIAQSAGGVISETAAKVLLARYDIPVVGEALVEDVGAAVAAASELGYPVALKVQSPDILHKTDAGVLRLGLRDAGELRTAYAEIMANAAKVANARIDGVVVQPMIGDGLEIMVGAKIDPMFGPMVMVGLGGIFVELLRDTQIAVAPVTASEARAMLERLKGAQALHGFRGSEPVDLDRLAQIVAAISQFASDQRDGLSEFDINPLICRGSRITAVDAVIVCAGNATTHDSKETLLVH